jgi:hypothetical protein
MVQAERLEGLIACFSILSSLPGLLYHLVRHRDDGKKLVLFALHLEAKTCEVEGSRVKQLQRDMLEWLRGGKMGLDA